MTKHLDDRPWLERTLTQHPQIGNAVWMATVAGYLIYITVPGLVDPKQRWFTAIFLLPIVVMTIALMLVIYKLAGLTFRMDSTTAEPPQPEPEVAEFARPEVFLLHAPEDCPGPQFMPDDGSQPAWVDTWIDQCRKAWHWHGDRWIQEP